MSQNSAYPVRQAGRSGERRSRSMAAALLTSALAYVALALTFDPVGPVMDNAVDVFVSGTVPTLSVILVLWLARPVLLDRALRRTLVVASLAASAGVALVPCILAGL